MLNPEFRQQIPIQTIPRQQFEKSQFLPKFPNRNKPVLPNNQVKNVDYDQNYVDCSDTEEQFQELHHL